MNTVRGAVLWLGPALLGSFLCTAIWHMTTGGDMADWRPMLSLTLMTLAFTIGGSTLLTLVFSLIGFLPSGARYLVLVLIGGIAGGALMLLSGGRPLILTGIAYGAVTAGLWACFHLMLFGRSKDRDDPRGSLPAA